MFRWRLILVTFFLGVISIPQLAFSASYDYRFEATRDGHVKIWRTYNGARISPDPAIDSDVKKGEVIYVSGDTEWVNDCDVKWDDADGLKNCNFVAHSYAYNRFEDFLAAHPGPLEHYALIDVGETEISAGLELELWHNFLQSNPLPDPTAIYNFVNGTCPDLPGYTVTETVSGLAFNGTCEVIARCTLSLNPQSVPSTNLALLAVLVLLMAITGIIIRRHRARA